VQSQGWELLWADLDALPEYWRIPEPSVLAWAESLWKEGGCQACPGRRVLDFGCGIGRHTVPLVCQGFAVTATDISPGGLKTCAAWLASEDLDSALACHVMGAFPFADHAFDGLIAYHVIYHATLAGMQRVLAEVRRVLCPGGRLYVTMLSREDDRVAIHQGDVKAGKCREIEPFTFIYPHIADAPGDKYLPHHYCDEAGLHSLLADFVIDDLRIDRREHVNEDGTSRFSAHYHAQARRR
jgi:SAM-dependent methyltransferase